jgi:hypothetical protein
MLVHQAMIDMLIKAVGAKFGQAHPHAIFLVRLIQGGVYITCGLDDAEMILILVIESDILAVED